MPYIAFELDAMARAEHVARSRGLPDTIVKGGLLNLWAHCFRETTDDVARPQLQAFFGHDIAAELVTFGFLEPRSDAYRVRGAGRYLRLKKAYAKGAAKTNALRRRPKASGGDALGRSPETPSQRAASSEQRAATTKEELAPASRTRVLSDRLVASFLDVRGTAYLFTGSKDGPALARLLKICDSDDEVDRRWRAGLRAQGWGQVSTVAQLAAKWNDLTAPPAKGAAPPTTGYQGGGAITAEDFTHEL